MSLFVEDGICYEIFVRSLRIECKFSRSKEVFVDVYLEDLEK